MSQTISSDRLAELRSKARKLDRIEDAWENEGINQSYHMMMRDRLRRSWPVLGAALDAIKKKR